EAAAPTSTNAASTRDRSVAPSKAAPARIEQLDAYLNRTLARATLISIEAEASPPQRSTLKEIIDAHFRDRSEPSESTTTLLALFRQLRHAACLPVEVAFELDAYHEAPGVALASLGKVLKRSLGLAFASEDRKALYGSFATAVREYRPLGRGAGKNRVLLYRASNLNTRRNMFSSRPVEWLTFGYLALAFSEQANGGRLQAIRIDTAAFLERYESSPMRSVAGAQSGPALYQLGTEIWSMALAPDASCLAVGGADGMVQLLSPSTNKELRRLEGHTARVSALSFSADGQKLLSGGYDGAVRLWHSGTGNILLRVKDHSAAITSVAISPDGSKGAVASLDGTTILVDLLTGRDLSWLIGHEGAVSSLCFSPDGSKVLTGSIDRTVRLWSAETGRELQAYRGHLTGVQHVSFSNDGRRLLSCSGGAALKDGKLVPGLDYTIRVWDVKSGEELQRCVGHGDWVMSAAFSPEGQYIVSGSGGNVIGGELRTPASDQSVRIWDVATGTELLQFAVHKNIVTSVSFSPDGRQVFSGSWDGTVRSWDFTRSDQPGSSGSTVE
ncbi:MAG TPA: WD40 repeat domain-containing protein, partial [Chthoniobacteraceae bacterium]